TATVQTARQRAVAKREAKAGRPIATLSTRFSRSPAYPRSAHPREPHQPASDRGAGPERPRRPAPELEPARGRRVPPGAGVGDRDLVADPDLGAVGDDGNAMAVVEVAERGRENRVGGAEAGRVVLDRDRSR